MIDHLVYATPHLEATVADLARQGLGTSPGGAHDGLGTRNALADLGGGAYLEVIGPDPDQPEPAQPRPFGIDGLTAPRLVAWAVRVDNLDAAVATARSRGHDPGAARDMARLRGDGLRLAWRLTPMPATVPAVVPFLIAWGDTEHPSLGAARGARLESLTLAHPDPAAVREQLAAVGVTDIAVEPAPAPALHAVLRTPSGPVDLG
ncbi:glyoxalase-like protein [Pseudonocardia hierapolitana]|uniref:Glyoxalase-like protein n=1 Tax=Pseudonocardia hierapolitana TaxID=1128676 RepID=A0A561T3Q9_9PSEU|nr:VOC family protein [Pseudonocardia hierapolitana]TWF81753.1 glyoxalase-like protein [Pseudonocardia hierapolitana]